MYLYNNYEYIALSTSRCLDSMRISLFEISSVSLRNSSFRPFKGKRPVLVATKDDTSWTARRFLISNIVRESLSDILHAFLQSLVKRKRIHAFA